MTYGRISILLAIMAIAVPTECYTPSSKQYLFGLLRKFRFLHKINFFDDLSVCNAPTDPAKTKLPTLEDMMYFNYYAASMYSSFDLKNLTCEYCEKFKNDVIKHTMLRNDTHNTLALVTLSEIRKEIVVAFRGSSNIWNVLLDLFMIMGGEGISEIEGIKLHRGFYIATMSLYDAVTSAVGHLQSLKPDYAKYVIVLCGHSLGGAMSRMTQYFWHVLNQFPGAKFKVITYGEPRSGNKHYVDYLNGKTDITARVSARSDVVCHFPTTKVLGNDDPYMHVQTEYFIDGKDNQRFCDRHVYEDRNCSMSFGPVYSLLDHLWYFDVDVMKMLVSHPHVLTSLPFGIFEPLRDLPPFPKEISNFCAGATHLWLELMIPAFG